MLRFINKNYLCRIGTTENGFALMPLILAVLIMGALIGVGLTIIAPRIKKEKYNLTTNRIDSAIQALVSWSATNGRLPNSATFFSVINTADDAWRKNLIYVYDNDLTAAATGGICGRQTTGISLQTTQDIAFLILSGGDDYTVDSTPSTSGQYNGNITASSKDIIKFVTLKSLKNRIGCYAATEGLLHIINNELPKGCSGQTYTTTIYAEGGVPFSGGGNYKWCLKGSLPGGLSSTPGTPACPSTSDCSLLSTEASSQWSQANTLQLSGTPTSVGSFPIVVLTRDNNDNNTGTANDNCVQKTFLISILSCGGGPTPVSNWDFNEGSGSTVNDAQGGNSGRLKKNTAWSEDTPDGTGSSLSFDGSADYVKVNDSTSLHLTDEFTLSAWVKETAVHSYATILSRRLGNYFYLLGVDNGHPFGGVGDGSNFSVTGKSLLMSLNEWNHLAFAYNDATDKMFIHFDGTEKETPVTLTLPPQPGVNLSIGADSGGTVNFFTGVIDDVRIFAKALTASEIRDIYSGTLIQPHTAFYAFNNNGDDSSGNGHNGTVNGAVFVNDRDGNPAGALQFDGNDSVIINDHADFQITEELTLMAWVKETSPTSYAKIISRRSGNYFYFLGVDNGHPYGGVGDGSTYTVTQKSIDMAPDQWHLIAFVYNHLLGKIYIYYDGIVDLTDVTISLPDINHVKLTIGGDEQGHSNFFEGLIDDVKIFNSELTADEIRQTYK